MRCGFHWVGTIGLVLLSIAPAFAADGPVLGLSDPGLPLQEIRPLDRHVWVLALEGKWKQPPTPGFSYYVNLLFPNGGSYSHRVLDDATFAAGEVRCLVPEYQLVRNGAARGRFVVVVSARRTVTSAKAPEIISEGMVVNWPMDRPILRWAPPTRFSPPVPIDAMPLPGQRLPSKPGKRPVGEPLPPPKGKIQPGEPPPVPD
ncbi:MAG TPA: hypothetical protein VH643_30035 [Gemmataceae bacterium]